MSLGQPCSEFLQNLSMFCLQIARLTWWSLESRFPSDSSDSTASFVSNLCALFGTAQSSLAILERHTRNGQLPLGNAQKVCTHNIRMGTVRIMISSSLITGFVPVTARTGNWQSFVGRGSKKSENLGTSKISAPTTTLPSSFSTW